MSGIEQSTYSLSGVAAQSAAAFFGSRAAGVVLMFLLIFSAAPGLQAAQAAPEGRQEIYFSEYAVFQGDARVGSCEVREFRRADGSRSYLVREHQTFFGPVLDRFMLVTLDPNGHFDSGHWVATSEFSADFSYRFHFDGSAIRGEWVDTNRGQGWADVPSPRGAPVVGFWGFPESLLLSGFKAGGPDRQTFEAVNVEDNLHRQVSVVAERLGKSEIEVPAGKFNATRYRVDRFGDTHQWLDEAGTLIRWSSEGGDLRWDLQRYPSKAAPPRSATPVARGVYEVSARGGEPLGTLEWSLEKTAAGELELIAAEHLDERTSRFRGSLTSDLKWKGSSESVDWVKGQDKGPPGLQHFETFFYREKFHLLRFQDRAYPYLQSRAVENDVPFHLINHPVSATFWLPNVRREADQEHSIGELAIFEHNYWGPGVEVQKARAVYLGRQEVESPAGPIAGHGFKLKYPGGWHASELTYWTDSHLVPMRVKLGAGKGYRHYRLASYTVLDATALPSIQ